jgi:prevent-host-death family protein
MQKWSVQDARARFDELLDACTARGPQLLTRRGVDSVVLVPIDEWRRVKAHGGPSLKALLLANDARTDDLVPLRSGVRRRSEPPRR